MTGTSMKISAGHAYPQGVVARSKLKKAINKKKESGKGLY